MKIVGPEILKSFMRDMGWTNVLYDQDGEMYILSRPDHNNIFGDYQFAFPANKNDFMCSYYQETAINMLTMFMGDRKEAEAAFEEYINKIPDQNIKDLPVTTLQSIMATTKTLSPEVKALYDALDLAQSKISYLIKIYGLNAELHKDYDLFNREYDEALKKISDRYEK